ncbi:sensor histidine kinase [Motilibacter deserti]|uniref:histidine kinase n=1 Tax=Motilibacter deserti TaxID=2714956 RepID=A0ABX0GYA5_9ACTN|nr:ATP-binding protein [Motilibacter deserti]NHC15580.1 sensor histidine kinase [Motilibacter deserti]
MTLQLTPRIGTPPAGVAAGIGALALALTALGQAYDPTDAAAGDLGLPLALAVSFAPLGYWVVLHRPGHVVGQLMLAVGLAAVVASLATSWARFTPFAWVGQWSWWPPVALLLLCLLVFPDGRLPGRRWRAVAVGLALAAGLATTAMLVGALGAPRSFITDTDAQLTGWPFALRKVTVVAMAAVLLASPAVLWSLVQRWRAADALVRRQLTCLVPACLALLVGVVLDIAAVPYALPVAVATIPLGMAVAILRHRLYDLDVLVSRAVVWPVMTLLVIAAFSVAVGLLGLVVGERTTLGSIVATALVAVAFEPVRARVQRRVDAALFGKRDEPYIVLSQLADSIRRVVDAQAALRDLPSSLVELLRVPWVSVVLRGAHGQEDVLSYGRQLTPPESFPLLAHDKTLGELQVGRRSSSDHFSAKERRLLQDLAAQAALAAEASVLTRDVQHARERLVLGREEERRRLRRELHDGMRGTLIGMSMQLRALERGLPAASPEVGRLRDLERDLRGCADELGRLVDELRPAALDGGLEAALRRLLGRISDGPVDVSLQVVGGLDALPAAVEVAALRIVSEAVTNAVRHAETPSCTVTVERGRELRIVVDDEGRGLGADRRAGVGLDSMAQRAEELGGSLTVSPRRPRGTSVEAVLPLPPG